MAATEEAEATAGGLSALRELALGAENDREGRRASRVDRVYATLLTAIRLQRYQRGERIREDDVARALGVSRTPVREALLKLQARGLLEMASGGLVVAELSRAQVMELYAMQEIIEGSASRFAAETASRAEIGALSRLHDRFCAALGEPEQLAQLNRAFHQAIYESAHNRYLMRTWGELHDTLTLLPRTTFHLPKRPEAVVEEHADMLDAIRERDPDKAERLARRHIANNLQARLDLMFATA